MAVFYGTILSMVLHKNPWRTKSQKTVYENPWVKVVHNEVITPNGKDGIYGVINIPTGVAIVAIDNDQNVYLSGEWRYPIKRYSWSVICGTVEKGQTPLQAAKQELKGEANLKASSWKHLLTFHPSPGIVNETTYVYLAQGLAPAKGKQDDTEKIKAKKIKFSRSIEMIDNGEITDSYAIVGLLKTYVALNKN